MSAAARAVSVPIVLVGVIVLAALNKIDGAAVLPFFTAVLGFGAGAVSGVVATVREGRSQERS